MSRAKPNPVYRLQVDHYRERQAAFAAERGNDPAWLGALREQAIAGFAELGFPSPRLEEWKYTNVAAFAKLPLELEAGDGVSGAESLEAALARDEDGLCERLARVPAMKDRAFALLNTAFLADGAVVRVAADERPEAPFRLKLSVPSAGCARHPRVLVDVAAGAQATVVVEQEASGAESLSNLVVDAEVGANASLDLVLLQLRDQLRDQPGAAEDASLAVSNTSVRIARDGRFACHTLTAGGALVRNDLDVVLEGEGAECDLRGLFLGSGRRLVDNHSSVDHAVPHCTSRELYKGILSDRSKGIFRGRVVVRPDAQKTDATQSNPNLLLGEGAEIDTKPQLEIYADDVKCSHGATVGQLDEDAIFYLRSRGIGEDQARAMMIQAFANEILDALPCEDLAERMPALLPRVEE